MGWGGGGSDLGQKYSARGSIATRWILRSLQSARPVCGKEEKTKAVLPRAPTLEPELELINTAFCHSLLKPVLLLFANKLRRLPHQRRAVIICGRVAAAQLGIVIWVERVVSSNLPSPFQVMYDLFEMRWKDTKSEQQEGGNSSGHPRPV